MVRKVYYGKLVELIFIYIGRRERMHMNQKWCKLSSPQ